MEEKRDAADGVAGWISERAGEWSLDDVQQSELMELQKYLWNPLMDF